jgi:hypothetical protein
VSLSGIIISVSSAIVGLIGAAIGALAGVGGAVISQRMQARATQQRTLESKKEEAYSSTLRYLLRVQNRRSGLSGESGMPYIAKEGIKDFFDDMVDAQFWVSTLTIYCAEDQRETVEKVSRALNETVALFVSGESRQHIDKKNPGSLPYGQDFRSWYETILACAREDIGESNTG